MGTRDEASLTDRERAILAALAAKAEEDDPKLAAALRGRRAAPAHPRVPAALHHWCWGAVLVVFGLAVMLVGVATTAIVGVVGVGLMIAGVARLVVTFRHWGPQHRSPS